MAVALIQIIIGLSTLWIRATWANSWYSPYFRWWIYSRPRWTINRKTEFFEFLFLKCFLCSTANLQSHWKSLFCARIILSGYTLIQWLPFYLFGHVNLLFIARHLLYDPMAFCLDRWPIMNEQQIHLISSCSPLPLCVLQTVWFECPERVGI